MPSTTVAALYKFVALPDYQTWRDTLHAHCERLQIKGTLLLAAEGINGTIAGSAQAIAEFRAVLLADPRFAGLEYKEAQHPEAPFLRLKVKLREEIVTMGVPNTDPTQQVGTYVDAADWNALIDDPDTLVIDTRNAYETAIGRFRGATVPNTRYFREFPAYVDQQLNPAQHKKIAMYCTGGIRCEKASHYLLRQGFDEVYHLRGGILKYLEDVPAQDNRWEGECFVFDERVAVGHALKQGDYVLCRACRHPVSPAQRQQPEFEDGVSCPHCHAQQTPQNRARARERNEQMKLAERRGQVHLGPKT